MVSRTLTTLGKRLAGFSAFGLLTVGFVLPVDAAGQLYRYRNAEGHAEISHSIPPSRAPLGYEVLDAYSMRVVEVVEPQKSPEEIARLERETQARDACQDALDRVNRRYQSELDVSAARDQAVRSILTRIENAKVNLAQVQNQRRELEAEAARQERSGNALDVGLRNNIERANQQAKNLQEEIAQRHAEHEATEARFTDELKLFLQGTCEDERAMRFLQAGAAE